MKFVRFLAWWAVFLGTAVTSSVAGEGGNSKEPPANPDPQHLVWIKPGTFTMGSPSTEPERYSEEGPQTRVTISQGFWMSKYETTQEEYMAVMGINPSYFKGEARKPVEQVSWDDATNYCAKLTARKHDAGTLPAGYAYRLPTEAEWEYACRAGTTTATAYGDSLSSTQANFCGSSPYNGIAEGPYIGKTTKVVPMLRMRGVCMICMETSGNGVWIGLALILVEVKQIPEERLLARSEYFAGAVGTTTVGTAVRRSALDASLISGTATLDSVPSWHQFHEQLRGDCLGFLNGQLWKAV